MKLRQTLGVMLVLLFSISALAGGWRFVVEPQHRVGMNMELSGSGYANDPGMASLFPGRNYSSALNWQYAARPGSGAATPPTDDITQFANRTFDDGFVNVSPFTTELDPITWNWGWQDAGQYNAQARQLTFARSAASVSAGSYADTAEGRESRSQTTVLLDGSLPENEDFSAPGLEAAARYTLFENVNAVVELCVGIAAWWGERVGLDEQTYAAHIREDSYRTSAIRNHEYDYSGSYLETYVYDDPFSVVPATAPPPYSHNDDANPGPVINALPSSRTVAGTGGSSRDGETGYVTARRFAGSRSWDVANAVHVDADVNNTALRVGAVAMWKVFRIMQVFVQPLVSLNYLQADLARREQLTAIAGDGTVSTLAEWRDSASDEEWILGVGLHGGVDVMLGERWFLECSAGYEWMTRKPEFNVGPSTVKMDLDAFEVSVGIGVKI